jgi:hypothetical protein
LGSIDLGNGGTKIRLGGRIGRAGTSFTDGADVTTSHEKQLEELLRAELAAHGAKTATDEQGFRLADWPHAHVQVRDVFLLEGNVVADVLFGIGVPGPRAAIHSLSVGVGSNREEMLTDAASQWMHNVAPPALSLLTGEASLGAEWCPSGSARGVDGWDCYVGPCALRGDNNDLVDAMRSLLEFKPLTALARKEVSAALDPKYRVHSVSLYVSRVGNDERFCEGRIDGAAVAPIEERLRSFPFPELPGTLISARQFVVAIRADRPAARSGWRGALDRLARLVRIRA